MFFLKLINASQSIKMSVIITPPAEGNNGIFLSVRNDIAVFWFVDKKIIVESKEDQEHKDTDGKPDDIAFSPCFFFL